MEIIQQLEDFATYNFIPALVIEGHELMVISGIGEYPRRIRKLRVEHGWPIISGVAPKDIKPDPESAQDDIPKMKSDEYCLLENKQDKEAAKRWKTANQVRKSKGGVKEKMLRYFRLNVGKPINGEELRYIANRSKEWARRSKELRTEEGSPIATRFPAAVLPFPLCDRNSLTLALTDQLSLEMSKRPVTLSNRFDMGESSPVKVKFSFT